ncbi:MAG: hypothetical protein U1F33_15740 [Alphaproteobacteria bacterium]|mgnify:CR=1 FL=1
MKRSVMTAALAALSFCGAASHATAAPQIMALLPTDGAKTLACAKGFCRAEFTVICLQVERRAPVTGVAYDLMPGSNVAVVLSRSGREDQRIDAGSAHLTVTSLRTHVSVEIRVPETVRRSSQAASISISVPKTAFLIPKPAPDDPTPITIAEVRGVVGQHLRIAPQFERDVAAGLAAARILSELVNELPTAPNTTPAEERRIANAVFARVLAAEDRPHRLALDDVRRLFERCQYKSIRIDFGTAQSCLEADHDSVMSGINMVYWNRTQGG